MLEMICIFVLTLSNSATLLKNLFMKSKITIEIDYDNQPIIRINYEPSDDVRDGLVKRFLETFGGKSSYASFRFVDSPSEKPNSIARLRPIEPKDMENVARVITDEVKGVVDSDGFMNGADSFVQKNNLNYSCQIQS
jgi:hypothetical protein